MNSFWITWINQEKRSRAPSATWVSYLGRRLTKVGRRTLDEFNTGLLLQCWRLFFFFFLVVAFSSFMQSFFKMREASSLCLDSQLAVALAIQEVKIGTGELGSHLGETSSLNTSVTMGRLIPVRLTGDMLWWGRPPLARWHDCHFDWLRRQSRDWVNLEVPRVGFFWVPLTVFTF